ncbi:MAG: hypothetical protein EOP84_31210, partial [Verrucomicrobiaceae bacterium]
MTGSRFVPGPAAASRARLRFDTVCTALLLGFLAVVSSHGAAPPDVAVIVRHAPQINGQGRIEGSIQQNLGEPVTINGGAVITHEFLVPGTPSVIVDPNGVIGSRVQDSGGVQPSNYQFRVNGGASIQQLRSRVEPSAFPVVALPPAPQGTRNVNINKAGESAGNWATVRNLQVNGQAGIVAVPPGIYGELTANSSAVRPLKT